jgi:hypothetical protein
MTEVRKQRKLSRRVFVFGTIGAGAAVGMASLGVATGDEKVFVIRLVQRTLPGVTLDPRSMPQFADDFIASEGASNIKWRLAASVDEVLGPDALAKLGLDAQVEGARVRALTFLLANSNFFALREPRSEPVVYVKRTVCGIPFRN